MQLSSRMIYRLDNRDFDSLRAAQTHLENEIGKVLDTTSLRLDPKTALEVLAAIVRHHARLVDLLTVEIESDERDGEGHNLLDMDL